MNVEDTKATPAADFEGNWNDVDLEHGGWDGPTEEQEEAMNENDSGWESIDCEDMASIDADIRMNKMLARHGEIAVYAYPGGDPGMGSFVKLFKLP